MGASQKKKYLHAVCSHARHCLSMFTSNSIHLYPPQVRHEKESIHYWPHVDNLRNLKAKQNESREKYQGSSQQSFYFIGLPPP